MAHVFITWDTFSFLILLMAWLRMLTADPYKVRRTAKLQDSSQTGVFAFVIVSACASLLALGFLLATGKGLSKAQLTGHVLLSLSTVILSWWLVHTTFALRYAHLFYGESEKKSDPYIGGLEFPDETRPDYLDFAYFSFVVGMTCQVSDVQISSRRIRRLALLHGLVSFVFNTAILALSINVISGLL